MAEIGLRNLTKVYGQDVTAVDRIDLDVRDGEFMVLLGPSGCGKSTTLRMIAGLEAITSGEIMIDGDVVNDVDPAERDLAVVFQNYALYPHMSVAETSPSASSCASSRATKSIGVLPRRQTCSGSGTC